MHNRFFARFLALLSVTFGMASCKSDTTSVDVSKPQIQLGQSITSDTLSGSIKGTLLSGHTYYFASDITINAGDTVLMQSGVTLIALGTPGSATTTPQITVNGAFISLGTKDKQNYVTILPANRTTANVFKGWWGGFLCTNTCPLFVLKWTHVEYAGGPAGPNADGTIYVSGLPRYSLEYANPYGDCIIEDSWFYGSTDDCFRSNGGRISILRNTFESTCEVGGESINMKSGTVGDIAYNMIIGTATNGIKWNNANGVTTIQTDCRVYNNTIVNCGFRQAKTGRGGSGNIEKGGKGTWYNNMVVNCMHGFRVVPGDPASGADTANLFYDNTFYYGNSLSLVKEFNCSDGISRNMPLDVRTDQPKTNDPQFVNFDVDKYDFSMQQFAWPVSVANMPDDMRFMTGHDFHLKPTSPAVGKGTTTITPLHSVKTVGGDFGATFTAPGKDIGAYQLDGTGNQH